MHKNNVPIRQVSGCCVTQSRFSPGSVSGYLCWDVNQSVCALRFGNNHFYKSETQTTTTTTIIRESCIDCFLIPTAAFQPGFDVLIDSCFHRFIHVFIQQPFFLQVQGLVLRRGNQCKSQTKFLPAQYLELMEENKQMYNKA